MATAAYRAWVNAGRPFKVCTPILAYRAQLTEAGWPGRLIGTIGDEAHLTAERPQDHTPFSVTGWPQENPYPYVHALDLMHKPEEGFDVNPIVAHWLWSARAGLTPWVKYIIWRGQRFDVRNNWQPVSADGHYDHAHKSFRTDHTNAWVDGWNVLPTGGTDMDQKDRDIAWATTNRALATLTGTDAVYRTSEDTKDRVESNKPAEALKAILAAVTDLCSRPPTTVDPIALADALAANDAFVAKLATAIAGQMEPSLTLTEVGNWLADKFRTPEGG